MKAKEDIIGDLMFIGNIAQLRHWCTNVYAEHIALEEFYVSLLPLVDQLAESIIKNRSKQFKCEVSSTGMVEQDGRVNVYLNAFENKWKDNEFLFTRSENNVIDDIFSLIDSTLYKLNNLV